jgi:ketosteroid isomerase-like protein
MTRRTILSITTVIAIAAVAVYGRASAQTGGASSGGVNKAMLERVSAAWASMDVAKAAPFYAKDPGLVFYDVAPVKYTGWAEYAKGSQDVFKTLKSMTMKVNDDAQVHNHGNLAWAAATLQVEMVPNDGNAMKMNPRWSTVWEKRGGNWLIVHEHFSMSLPGPPQ